MMAIVALILFVCFIGWLAYNWPKKKVVPAEKFSADYHKILADRINFYKKLDEAGKANFEKRMLHFLSHVRITGVGTTVTPEDRVYVAASAIIPIVGFPNWQYNNLNEVLLYPGSFNKDFDANKMEDQSVLGMVGNGPMQHMMVLSQHSLRQGFNNKTDKDNTGIHEFVHLLDKTDGEVDGVPENLIDKQHLLPWIKRMHDSIQQIKSNRSDIDPYGATNEAEFFAVAAEYFFERPDLLQSKHPELYKLLESIFQQSPGEPA
jgi:MtfA peptidase